MGWFYYPNGEPAFHALTQRRFEPLSEADAHPVLLCVPGINGHPEEHILPYRLDDNQVTQTGDIWNVTVTAINEVIYAGPGPVQVRRSTAPF